MGCGRQRAQGVESAAPVRPESDEPTFAAWSFPCGGLTGSRPRRCRRARYAVARGGQGCDPAERTVGGRDRCAVVAGRRSRGRAAPVRSGAAPQGRGARAVALTRGTTGRRPGRPGDPVSTLRARPSFAELRRALSVAHAHRASHASWSRRHRRRSSDSSRPAGEPGANDGYLRGSLPAHADGPPGRRPGCVRCHLLGLTTSGEPAVSLTGRRSAAVTGDTGRHRPDHERPRTPGR